MPEQDKRGIVQTLQDDLKVCSEKKEELLKKLPPVPGLLDRLRGTYDQMAAHRENEIVEAGVLKVACERLAFFKAERAELTLETRHSVEITALYKEAAVEAQRNLKVVEEMREKHRDTFCDVIYLSDELAWAKGKQRNQDWEVSRARKRCFDRALDKERQKR